MISPIFSSYAASVSDLQNDPMRILEQGETVAILDHNHPIFYCVPAKVYEEMLEMMDDAHCLKILKARAHEKEITVSLDDL